MFAKSIAAAALVTGAPAAKSGFFELAAYKDNVCQTAVQTDKYEMQQDSHDEQCYFNKGYSIKLSCGQDDTITVDHWLDTTGKQQPCTGNKMPGDALMQDVLWEDAVELFKGGCVYNANMGQYGKLSSALPANGYPKCDFTGVSFRRLSNSTNSTPAPATPTPPTPTPPTPTPPTPTPPTPASNASNATNSTPTPAPATPAPPTPPGVASSTIMEALAPTALALSMVAAVVV